MNKGWKLSLYEESIKLKSKDEVRKQFEESLQYNDTKSSVKSSSKLSRDELTTRVSEDLETLSKFKRNHNIKDYSWEIITEIHENRKNSLAEIFEAFIESCFDFVQNKSTLEDAGDYIEELIKYYAEKIEKSEKTDLVNVTLELVQEIHNVSSDNKLMIDLWAKCLIEFEKSHIIELNMLRGLTDLTVDNIKDLFEVYKKMYIIMEKYDENEAICFKNKIQKFKYVEENRDTFDDILGGL